MSKPTPVIVKQASCRYGVGIADVKTPNPNRKGKTMSEEKEAVEETEEVTEELEDTLDEGQEEDQDPAEEGVAEEEPEAEPVDERGVPWKNKVAELERKLNAERGLSGTYKELIDNITKNQTKQEQKVTESILKSLTDEEFEAVNIDAKTAAFLRKSQYIEAQRAIADKLAEADSQNRQNQQVNQEFTQERIAAVREAQSAITGEFGDLVVDDGQGGLRYAEGSPLFKRAQEIFKRSPQLQKVAAGPAIAAQRAEIELIKEKYGKSKPNKSKAEHMKGKGSSRSGTLGSMRDTKGNFTRPLTDKEFDLLDREGQEDYLIAEVENRAKWFRE